MNTNHKHSLIKVELINKVNYSLIHHVAPIYDCFFIHTYLIKKEVVFGTWSCKYPITGCKFDPIELLAFFQVFHCDHLITQSIKQNNDIKWHFLTQICTRIIVRLSANGTSYPYFYAFVVLFNLPPQLSCILLKST